MGKIDLELKKLTLSEKIKLTYGKNYWETEGTKDFKHNVLTDGPHGVRLQKRSEGYNHINLSNSYDAIAYPSLSTLANSFSPILVYEVSSQIAKEAGKLGVDQILAPGINIIRDPRCGRAFEYFSEDPIVSGTLGKAYVKGLEENGVKACLKHFALNNQEYFRMINNSVVDSRTMHELYFKPFSIALEANPSALMMSYNMINGIHACENKALIDYLRHDLSYKGLLMSDWGAVGNSAKALKAGLNLEMPGYENNHLDYMLDKLNNGEISEEDIDSNARYVISYLMNQKKSVSFDFKKACKTNLKASLESAVLLKNDSILPLKKKDKILVVGYYFTDLRIGGSGSSEVNPSFKINPRDSFDMNGVTYSYIEGFNKDGNISSLDKALKEAPNYDKVLVFVTLPRAFESEGFDRQTLSLPKDYLKGIKKLAALNKNIIVILNSGGVTEINYLDYIKGLLYVGLPGSSGGEAIYELLFGKANPSGKLSQTYIRDCDTYLGKKYPDKNINVLYREGLYVGYPYYYLKNIVPTFSFGYGLSYSKFSYLVYDLDKTIDISIKTNRNGYETLFLFVKDKENYIRLKDYQKVMVKKDKPTCVSFKIEKDYFKQYLDNKFVLSSGKFDILIGTSLDNIIFKKEITISGKHKWVHPLIDLNLNQGLFKKGNKCDEYTTLGMLKNNKHYDSLVKRLITQKDLSQEKNLMILKQYENSINENPLHFYKLFQELDLSSYELDELIKKINQKNKIFLQCHNTK